VIANDTDFPCYSFNSSRYGSVNFMTMAVYTGMGSPSQSNELFPELA